MKRERAVAGSAGDLGWGLGIFPQIPHVEPSTEVDREEQGPIWPGVILRPAVEVEVEVVGLMLDPSW